MDRLSRDRVKFGWGGEGESRRRRFPGGTLRVSVKYEYIPMASEQAPDNLGSEPLV